MKRTPRLLTGRFLLVALVALAFGTTAGTVSAQTTGGVTGMVTDRDTGQPLPDALVSIEGTRLGDRTDENGRFFIDDVPMGVHTVTARVAGYRGGIRQQRVPADRTARVDLALETDPDALSTSQDGDERDGDLSRIRVVPNPYIAGESSGGAERILFTNLPPRATIRIYTISGNLIRTLDHVGDGDGSEEWNLRTRYGLLVASGNYYFHVTTPDGRTHLGRFAVIN